MNTISKIEIKESSNLCYSILFILKREHTELSKTIIGQYQSEEQRNHIRYNMEKWREYFVGWDIREEQDLLINSDHSIPEVHLLTKNNEAISIMKFLAYFNDL